MKRLIIISFLFLFLKCLPVFANELFIWTDEKGETHYSKTEPPGWETKQYESYETPEMAKIRRQREIDEDQRDRQLREEREEKSRYREEKSRYEVEQKRLKRLENLKRTEIEQRHRQTVYDIYDKQMRELDEQRREDKLRDLEWRIDNLHRY